MPSYLPLFQASFLPSKILLLTIILLFLTTPTQQFNASICGYIQMNSLYYFINEHQSDSNVFINDVSYSSSDTTKYTEVYNYCHEVEYWCSKQNAIITGDLVRIDPQGNCYSFKQKRIELMNENNASQGIRVVYSSNAENDEEVIPHDYPCNDTIRKGCPEVSRTTLWNYFSNNSVGYTIAIEVIGVLFMILGVYMYRVTLVILGWATAFIILLSIEQTVVFVPGVPEEDLANVMLITIICSFFVGYVMAYFPKAGLFCMGMWIGLIISLTLNNVALYLIYSTPQNLPLYIVLPVLCISFGILTVCVKRKFIIFATSLIGAYICLRALSWHLGAFPNELLYPEQYQLGLKGIVVWQFYLYVVALLILTASSSALQFWLFKKKSQKTNGSSDIDEHFDQMQHKLENQRQQLIEFENIFKKLKNQTGPKKPRVLRKNNSYDQDDEYRVKGKRNSYNKSESQSFGEEDQEEKNKSKDYQLSEQQPSQERYDKKNVNKNSKTNNNDLRDTLLNKKKQNKKKY